MHDLLDSYIGKAGW